MKKSNRKVEISRTSLGRISEQVLSGIVQSIEAAVVLHDREFKVVFVNDSFEKIFEIAGEVVLGKSPMEFLPEFDKRHKEAIFSRLQNTLETGKRSKYHEFSYCSPSGRYRYLLAISIPIFNRSKEITHVMSVIHDITHRKELEEEVVKAAKISSIADMAYTIAHEINNPLTGIKLGLHTLYDSLQTHENIQVLDSVMKDLNRIQKIVASFLKARKRQSRLEEYRLSVIGHILEDVLFHLSGQLDMQRITVEKDLCDEDLYISMDRDRIYQLFLNLLLNSIQSIKEEGKIRISIEIRIPFRESKDTRRFACISLNDTGSGIEPELRGEIFKPFYSTKHGGTGLGLSICKDILSAHKGFMELESNTGAGTTVNIYLPVAQE